MQEYNQEETGNRGSGIDYPIAELAEIIKDIIGYNGEIVYDQTKPNRTPRKLLNSSRLHQLGWKHTIRLKEGEEIFYVTNSIIKTEKISVA